VVHDARILSRKPASRRPAPKIAVASRVTNVLPGSSALLLTGQRSRCYSYVMAKGRPADAPGHKTDILQGTLDLMVLQTLDAMGPQHGYGIARRIEQVSDDALKLNEGTVYAALMRLQHQRWISASWGASENNRKAKFYAITPAGRRQLVKATDNWQRISGVIGRLLRLAEPR
jgi:PadR family transcriptional regulator, regulatory protein PadR